MTQSLDLDHQAARPDRPDEDDRRFDCVTETAITSFTAEPSVIKPSAGGATLNWAVEVPSKCPVALKLNGRAVRRSGTLTVQPAVTTRYSLTAGTGSATVDLGSVTVTVETSACITGTIVEALVRSQLRQVIDELDRASKRFNQRSPAKVEIDTRGIHVALRFRVVVDNIADPDLNIDLTVGLRVRNGSIDPYYRSFAVDVDWPWWVTVVTAGASKLVEEVLDEEIERSLKPRILEELKKQVAAVVDLLPDGLSLHTVSLAEDAVRVTACPRGPDTPFLVLPSMVSDGGPG